MDFCGKWDVEIEDTYFDNGIYQAIDLGITKIVTAINTEGKFFEVKTPVAHFHSVDIILYKICYYIYGETRS